MDTPLPSLPARIAAFDVGQSRIGIAVTDALGLTVRPLLTIYCKTPKADLKSIGRLIRKHGIAEAVVGNPLHMSGEQSPQAARAQAFAEALRAEFGVPVHLCDERLTTHEAHLLLDEAGHARGPERRRIIDQVAAVLILESFLEARAREAARSASEQAPATE
jgi:putative holliday junction resolvase